jgi:hypothetical protein
VPTAVALTKRPDGVARRDRLGHMIRRLAVGLSRPFRPRGFMGTNTQPVGLG